MTFTLKEVMSIGGICASIGGLGVWTLVNTKNITSLWDKKQDVKVCDPKHSAIESDISEIKIDVKWLRNNRENGGE